MFDNLFNLVKQNAEKAIINNPAIPNEKNDEAIAHTTTSILNSLKSQIASGNLNNVLAMFQNGGNTSNNQVVNAVNTNAATDLMNKFGLDKTTASGISDSLIPQVMNQLVSKTNDINDNSFDLKNIFGSIGEGSPGDMLGSVANMIK
jgi:uncharacterized protein YidB (DUF937 family)